MRATRCGVLNSKSGVRDGCRQWERVTAVWEAPARRYRITGERTQLMRPGVRH